MAVAVNTRLRESGDQTGTEAPRGMSVSERASPPPAAITWIWAGSGLPSFIPARRKARLLPSGDHREDESRGPAVNGRAGSPASAGTIQIAVS